MQRAARAAPNLGRAAPNGAESLVLSLNRAGVALAAERRLDEALGLLDQAVAIDPRHAASLHNRGAVQMMRGDLRGAAESYALTLALDPTSARGHFNLANICRSLGRTELAIAHLSRVVELDPGHHSAAHVLAATRGETTDHAPVAYVRELFDQYALTFERVLTSTLDYQTPRMLRELLVTCAGSNARFTQAVDLGCGTGLSGLAFHDCVSAFVGVDVSPGMLEHASDKGVYSRLERSEMVAYLRATSEDFDLMIAADALIYLGNLSPLFGQIARCALPGAFVLLSVEHTNEAGYVLTPSGRYAHSSAYIHALSSEHGMTVAASCRAALRKDAGRDVEGELFALRPRPV